ncbi:unnamed protein product [Brachionus calyciflorus]|uniref:MULE transposase domain-containing protein n=1 Tax=Brachionus calyciflorus TaxID=104777 RepID=A0A814BYW9_9BILA|nr:unnamed protein product [Brachionus calyciflorus]
MLISLVLPKNRSTLILKEYRNLFKSSNDQKFLIADSQDELRILIFATPKGLKVLQKSNCWHVDGTFKSCPNLYAQVFTIHCWYFDQMFPCVYILLVKKDFDIYKRILDMLKVYLPALRGPEIFVSDFETTSIKAFNHCLTVNVTRVSEPVTNNHLEGWHSKLNRWSKKAHPDVYSLIDLFKSLDSSFFDLLEKRKSSEVGPERDPNMVKKYEDHRILNENRIKSLITLKDYLEKASTLKSYSILSILNLSIFVFVSKI